MKNFLRKLWKSIEESQQKRADYKLLQMLNDRELRDLGIGRSQIYNIIYDRQD
jgi:uncharacterized protein YjiS (DUF1127 family)